MTVISTEDMLDGLKRLEEIMEKAEFRQWSAWLKDAQETLRYRRTEVDTPFGKLVANSSGDEDVPGICICIVEEDMGESSERPLVVVESIERDDELALRLVAWPSVDFDSYQECMDFLRKENRPEA